MRLRAYSVLVVALGTSAPGCHEPLPAGEEAPTMEEDEGTGSGSDGSDTGVMATGSTGEPEAFDPCARACTDIVDPVGAATCHSCRCKVAFDDWLPSPDELQCAHAEPIVTYKAQLAETDFELAPAPPGATHCANPSLLTGSCRQGSKLGQLTHGDTSFYWVCRDPYLDYDGTVLYQDMAIIGHNLRSGATCFWDDIDHVIHEDDAPALDLSEATEEEIARSAELLPHNDGSGCVTCHDHDPFIYTPYLQSTDWRSVAADKGPYHLVTLDGPPRATEVMHLVSPPAAPCTRCHRLGSDNTCSYFAPDSLGMLKISAYESEVREAAEPGSPHWRLAHWMPGEAEALTDFADWEAMFGEARDHVLDCCEAPGIDGNGCQWAPVPAE